jgi:hypothetical protein
MNYVLAINSLPLLTTTVERRHSVTLIGFCGSLKKEAAKSRFHGVFMYLLVWFLLYMYKGRGRGGVLQVTPPHRGVRCSTVMHQRLLSYYHIDQAPSLAEISHYEAARHAPGGFCFWQSFSRFILPAAGGCKYVEECITEEEQPANTEHNE